MPRLGIVAQSVVFPAGVSVREVLEQAAPADDEREAAIAVALGQGGFENAEALSSIT